MRKILLFGFALSFLFCNAALAKEEFLTEVDSHSYLSADIFQFNSDYSKVLTLNRGKLTLNNKVIANLGTDTAHLISADVSGKPVYARRKKSSGIISPYPWTLFWGEKREPEFDSMQMAVSSDEDKFAYVGSTKDFSVPLGMKNVVVEDGRTIETVLGGVGFLKYNKKGVLAYVKVIPGSNNEDRSKDKMILVFDGKKVGEYQEIESLDFDSDGRIVASVLKNNERFFLHGSKEYSIEGLKFAPWIYLSDQGGHLAITANQSNLNWAILDGKKTSVDGYKESLQPMVFSKNGSHLGFMIFNSKTNKSKIVIDGKEYEGNDTTYFYLLNNGKPLLLEGKGIESLRDGIDGKILTRNLYSPWDGPSIASDGENYAFAQQKSKSGGGGQVVFKGKRGKFYSDIQSLHIAPGGSVVVYIARKFNTKSLELDSFMVMGTEEGSAYDQIWPPVFSEDGKNLMYLARKGEKIFRVSEEIK